MALDVIEAMKQSKISPCDYPIVGIDATADGCEAVLLKIINSSFKK